MNSFAFLKHTPDFAKLNDCGQFNGYIAFDIQCDPIFVEHIKDSEGWEIGQDFKLPWTVNGESVEVTLFEPRCTLEKMGAILPITEIPQEAADGGYFMVFGFDTCHNWNSWEDYTYKKVREITLAWLREARRMVFNDFLDLVKRCESSLN